MKPLLEEGAYKPKDQDWSYPRPVPCWREVAYNASALRVKQSGVGQTAVADLSRRKSEEIEQAGFHEVDTSERLAE